MGSQNRVTSIHETPNEDGNNVVGIELGDGSTFDAVIDLPVAQLLVEILQRRLVQWAHGSAKNLALPRFDVSDIGIAHQGVEVGLLVNTAQMGHVLFRMQPDLVQKAHRELSWVMTYGSGPQMRN